MRFGSESRLPLDCVYELNMPFEYNYYISRFGTETNSIELDHKADVEVNIEVFADCLENISQKINDSIKLSYPAYYTVSE